LLNTYDTFDIRSIKQSWKDMEMDNIGPGKS